jgi:hypothetical protein
MVVKQSTEENQVVQKNKKLNKMVTVPVSVGEMIDKLSILQVKKNNIKDENKLVFINKEFELLYNFSSEYLSNLETESIYHRLVEVNSNLWEVEDKLRIMEKEQRFDEEFISLARKVYFTNDERFRLKNEINLITDSEIREIKDYVKY